MAQYQLITREEFFLSIWPSTLIRGETLELRILKRNPNRIYHRYFSSTVKEFLKEIDRMRTETGEFYFGVATRRGENGTKEGCFRAKTVWVDIDGTKNLSSRLEKISGLEPDIVVDSGGGLHLYWLLTTPIVLQDQKWLEIEAVNRGLCKRLFGDVASIDITRILRVPGTNNNKYDPPKLVRAYKRI